VEKIYEWGLSVGYRLGPSVVHSSVIFNSPQAPMCLPVGALYTYANMDTYTIQHSLNVCRKNPVTCPSHINGQLMSASFFDFISFATTF